MTTVVVTLAKLYARSANPLSCGSPSTQSCNMSYDLRKILSSVRRPVRKIHLAPHHEGAGPLHQHRRKLTSSSCLLNRPRRSCVRRVLKHPIAYALAASFPALNRIIIIHKGTKMVRTCASQIPQPNFLKTRTQES